MCLPKEKGFPPVAGLGSFTGGKAEFENKINGQKAALIDSPRGKRGVGQSQI